jgi:hypothetical protein
VINESIPRAGRLIDAGLDAIEVSSNVMRGYTDSAKPYVAVDGWRAAQDLLLQAPRRAGGRGVLPALGARAAGTDRHHDRVGRLYCCSDREGRSS